MEKSRVEVLGAEMAYVEQGEGDPIVFLHSANTERGEMAEYRRPFVNPGEGRRPTLTWPREIPIDGSPDDVVAIVDDHSRRLSTSSLPKLFVNARPGAILVGEQREFCRRWPYQTEVTVAGIHSIQEDSSDEIGLSLRRWLEAP